MDNIIVADICKKYGIKVDSVSDVIDTSHGKTDLRYNFIINNKYVLKMNSAGSVSEAFLQGINRLVMRYRKIGVWCPQILETENGQLISEWDLSKEKFKCYIEEYAPYQIAEEVEFYTFKEEMLEHIGKLAVQYTDVDLVEHKSMWSLIDLSPYDNEIDEKQENLDMLIEVLKNHDYVKEAENLMKLNNISRSHIRAHFELLPRCVYQGDLNPSNLLMDEQKHFVGLIDFNMYGTEVNINCFLNESMYYFRKEDFEELCAKDIFSKMNQIQGRLLNVIFRNYILNDIEKKVFEDYKRVVDMSFYPNVMLLIELIQNRKYVDKVIQLINLICEIKHEEI